MKNEKKLTLKIEDLEERIAPSAIHIHPGSNVHPNSAPNTVYLPDAAETGAEHSPRIIEPHHS